MKTDIIYNEDCLITMSKMADNSVDCVFTSPPYNRKRNDTYEHYDDIVDDYLGFLIKFTDECIRISKGLVFVNIQSNYYNRAELHRYTGHYADKICNTVVWTKENPMPSPGLQVTNAFEYFFCFGNKLMSNKTYTKNHIHTSVNPDTDKSHGAIMHIKVAKWFISTFTKENDVIYDPFMGIGTTARASMDLGRQYIGSEINSEYCRLAEQRLRQGVLL